MLFASKKHRKDTMSTQITLNSGIILPDARKPANDAIPENIRQLVSLMTAVLERISEKRLDISGHKCLYTNHNERRSDHGRIQYHPPVGTAPDFVQGQRDPQARGTLRV
jgi:hypothetical protein